MWKRESRLRVVSLLFFVLVAFASPARSADGIRGCADFFGNAGDATIASVSEAFPSLGIMASSNGVERTYYVWSHEGKQEAKTLADLPTVVLAALASNIGNEKPLDIYFQGVDLGTAWNLISTARIKSAPGSRDIEGFATPASGGRGGNGNFGGTATATAGPEPQRPQIGFDNDGEKGSPPGDDASTTTEPWRLAFAFRSLDKRYDWRRAETHQVLVKDVLEKEPIWRLTPPGEFDPNAYSFRIVVPRTVVEPGASFSAFVFFKSNTPKPHRR